MSPEIAYVVRGKCKETKREYKITRGRLVLLHEARGEDQYASRFFAIHACLDAARSWNRANNTITFDVYDVPANKEKARPTDDPC